MNHSGFEPDRAGSRHGAAVRCSASRRQRRVLQRDSRPRGVSSFAALRADGGGSGSSPRHCPRCVRSRTRSVLDHLAVLLDARTRDPPTTTAAPRPGDDRSRHGHSGARSGRQPVTALGAAGFQHCAPGPSAHAMTKAVLLGPAAIVRLEGALHPCLLISAAHVWRPTAWNTWSGCATSEDGRTDRSRLGAPHRPRQPLAPSSAHPPGPASPTY